MNSTKYHYFFTDFQYFSEDGTKGFLKCSTFLINHPVYGGILFDTGSINAGTSLLEKIKNQTGLSPEDIKWVFITHVHPDHTGANKYFKNATIVLSKKDFEIADEIADVALSNANLKEYLYDKFPGYITSFNDYDIKNMKYLIKTYWNYENLGLLNNIKFIEDDPEIPDFINPVKTSGHTLFHYGYELTERDDNKKILVTGDAVSNRLIFSSTIESRYKDPNMDMDLYEQSLELIKNFNGILVPGHDKPFDSNTKSSIVFKKEQALI